METDRVNIFLDLKDVFESIRKGSLEIGASKLGMPAIKTGFRILDYWTNGLMPGDYIILAGRPSSGKSMFALNIALQAALASRKDSLFFSLGTPRERILMNLFTMISGISSSFASKGSIDVKNLVKMDQKLVSILDADNGKLLVHDKLSSIEEIAKEVQSRSDNSNLGIVIIDYLQLCECKSSLDDRAQELVSISRDLRKLAMKTKVPIFVLSSVRSDVDLRPMSKRPTLTDLNVPDEVVDDCDMVWMLYRDELYSRSDDNPSIGAVDLAILKNRRGKLNLIEMRFIEDMHRFEDISSL
jgi:replicative DNA helicase